MSDTETQESSNGKGSRSSLWEISSELVGTRHFRPIRLIPRQKPLYDYMCIYIPETQYLAEADLAQVRKQFPY